MKAIENIKTILLALALGAVALSCTPEVGTEAWCEMMGEKPKADWSGNEAADYAKHCVFR